MKTKAEVLFEIDSAINAHLYMLRHHKDRWRISRSHDWDLTTATHQTAIHERVSAMKYLKRIRKAVEMMED